MSTKAMLRSSLLGLFLLVGLSMAYVPQAAAQSVGKEETMSIDEFKNYLAASHRNLSQAKQEELAMLKSGSGSLSERVVKIGNSVFVLNLAAIYTVGLISIIVIAFFFTPIGLFLTRGSLHAAFGSFIKSIGISTDFGASLHKPKEYMKSQGVRKSFALYMHRDFIPNYKNNITAIAFMGTAFLILNIGLRGVKFMVAHQPDLIIIAILIEITVLMLLGMTTWYEKETEEDESTGAMHGKDLTLAEVQAKLTALQNDLAASVKKETDMRR